MKKIFFLIFLCASAFLSASSVADFKTAPGADAIKINATYSNPFHMCVRKCGLCGTKELSVIVTRNVGWQSLKKAFAEQLKVSATEIQVAQSDQALQDEPIDLETFDPKTPLHISLKAAR
jgi:hypothetical protein